MSYILCEGKDCPICKWLGRPEIVYLTIKDEQTGELSH